MASRVQSRHGWCARYRTGTECTERSVTSPRMGRRSSSKGVLLSAGVLLPEGIPILEDWRGRIPAVVDGQMLGEG